MEKGPIFLGNRVLVVGDSSVGERKLVTCLFGELSVCASLCQRLDPDYLYEHMTACFNHLNILIQDQGGIMINVSGAGFQALFGAPIACADHTIRACHAALEIRAYLGKLGLERS